MCMHQADDPIDGREQTFKNLISARFPSNIQEQLLPDEEELSEEEEDDGDYEDEQEFSGSD